MSLYKCTMCGRGGYSRTELVCDQCSNKSGRRQSDLRIHIVESSVYSPSVIINKPEDRPLEEENK